jgi:hypothetical protein
MAESGLSIGAPELRAEIGFFLGYGRTSGNWSSAKLSEINSIMQSGVRRVYYPKAVAPQTVGYEWSFLRPTTTISIVSGTTDYTLPDDLGRLVGPLHFPADEYRSSCTNVNLAMILELRASRTITGAPYYYATRYKTSTGATGQRQELLVYPTPDENWTMSYEYEAYSGPLTDSYPYPLGGMHLAELYIESCLAVCEHRVNDEQGIHSAQFDALLLDAIGHDQKRGPGNYGQMGDRDLDMYGRWRRGMKKYNGAYSLTYKGEYI